MTATVTGSHEGLRAGREGAGLKRPDIAGMTGFSVAVVARIEMRGGTAAEVNKYREALMIALGQVVTSEPEEEPEVPPVTKSPAVTGFFNDRYNSRTYTEWDGIKRGDLVRITNEQGQFKFMSYHIDDRGSPDGEWIDVCGPVVRYRDQLRGTRIRSFAIDRLVRSGKKRKHGQR